MMKGLSACLLCLLLLFALGGCDYYEELRELVEEASRTTAPTSKPAPEEENIATPTPTPATLAFVWEEGRLPLYPMGVETITYRLVVDIAQQVVFVYKADSDELMRTFACSTGRADFPTPEGEYTITGPESRWGYYPDWDCYARYITRIDSSIAFHSVPYSARDARAASEPALQRLGTRTTRGCIRLQAEDARWIYLHCPPGTQCEIIAGDWSNAI